MKPGFRAGLCLLVASAAVAFAQDYTISTFGGGGSLPTPAPALIVGIGTPAGIATDSIGNVYFTGLNAVFKVDSRGILTRVAGNSRPGYSGDGGPATNAQLNLPVGFGAFEGLAVDSAGAVYIADSGNRCVRKVAPNGIITTVAGNPTGESSTGDGGLAASSSIG